MKKTTVLWKIITLKMNDYEQHNEVVKWVNIILGFINSDKLKYFIECRTKNSRKQLL